MSKIIEQMLKRRKDKLKQLKFAVKGIEQNIKECQEEIEYLEKNVTKK